MFACKLDNGKVVFVKYLRDNTVDYFSFEKFPVVPDNEKQYEVVADFDKKELFLKEVVNINKQNRIDELKGLLAETDYEAIKYAEGWISDEDYAPIKAKRQSWRDEINSLET